MDLLLQAMEEYLKTPERTATEAARMYIVRSFSVNVPGTSIENLKGGVVGGSIIQGSFEAGEEVEIRPGLPVREKNKVKMKELFTEITSLHFGNTSVKQAMPGGLVGVGTLLDPSLTKSDGLVGSLIGKPGTLPPVLGEISLDIRLFENIIGSRDMGKVASVAKGERLLLNVGTAKTMGAVTKVSKDYLEATLTIPVCGDPGDRVALSRRIGSRWRLIGVGTLKG
jgi:translation initiation factor 2 subunit 3